MPNLPPPDPTDLAYLLQNRCAKLGTPACIVTPSGGMLATTPAPRSLPALLRTPMAVHALAAAPAAGARTLELFPGARLLAFPFAPPTGAGGRLVALCLTPAALVHPRMAELAHQARLDPRLVRVEFAPYAKLNTAGADVLGAALAAAVEDLVELSDHRTSTHGFTVQLSESFDTIDVLYTLGRSMSAPFDPHRFLALVAERLHSTMNFAWLAIAFSDAPATARSVRGACFPAGDACRDPEATRRAAIALLDSTTTFPAVLDAPPGFSGQVLAHPIACKGRPIGVIIAGGKFGADPCVSSYDIQLVEATAGYASAFADNVALYEDQYALFMGTVGSLTSAIDAKDAYTFGHSERVALMGKDLALAMGLSPEQAERIHIAGLVHDVGKIGVPEAVLTKPGKLTDDEFALIKLHPEIGHRILKDIPLLSDVLPGVLHHHERWDGRGYPHKLAGENIPLIARILAVADTFDAMSSNRSYRGALPRAHVLAEIARSAGTQLDPTVAAAFTRVNLAPFDALVAKHAGPSALAA